MPAGVVPADPAPRPNVRERWQLHARALSWQFSAAACISLGRASLGMGDAARFTEEELVEGTTKIVGQYGMALEVVRTRKRSMYSHHTTRCRSRGRKEIRMVRSFGIEKNFMLRKIFSLKGEREGGRSPW